jgi:hypothetical protein
LLSPPLPFLSSLPSHSPRPPPHPLLSLSPPSSSTGARHITPYARYIYTYPELSNTGLKKQEMGLGLIYIGLGVGLSDIYCESRCKSCSEKAHGKHDTRLVWCLSVTSGAICLLQ